jgi:fibronectin type 3 domain-containing protein
VSAREGDTVVILSSELISKITEEYFNKTMFKQKVEIVDLKPTETGYMFSVAFVQAAKKAIPPTPQVAQWDMTGLSDKPVNGLRDDKGKFMKVSK